MKKGKTNSHHLISLQSLSLILGGVLLAEVVLLGLRWYEIRQEKKPVIETHKSEILKLPKEAVRVISQAPRTTTFQVPVLMYHYVEYVQDKGDTIRQSLNINPYTFEQQVKTLSEAGYTFMTAREVGEVLDGTKILPPNPIVLTFDDGHWDIVTDIIPILKKYNAKGTVYVISDFINGSDFMSDKQMKEVVDSGILEIGAHTAHHVSLKDIRIETVEKEVIDSKKTLEDNYHIKVISFAYPNGAFDLQAAHVVEDAGFTTSVSTVPGINVNQSNRFFLYRLRPGGRIGEVLLNWLNAEKEKALENKSNN